MLNDAIAIPGTFFGGTATVVCNQPVAMIGLHFELRDGTIIIFSTLPLACAGLQGFPAASVDSLEQWPQHNGRQHPSPSSGSIDP